MTTSCEPWAGWKPWVNTLGLDPAAAESNLRKNVPGYWRQERRPLLDGRFDVLEALAGGPKLIRSWQRLYLFADRLPSVEATIAAAESLRDEGWIRFSGEDGELAFEVPLRD